MMLLLLYCFLNCILIIKIDNSFTIFLAIGIFSFIKSTVSFALPENSKAVPSILLTLGSFSSALFKTSKTLLATVKPWSNILFIGLTIFESKLFNIFDVILLISLVYHLN